MNQEALYQKVMNHICDKIIKKDLVENTILNEKDYAFENGVSKHIVEKAFNELLILNILEEKNEEYLVSEKAIELAISFRKERILVKEFEHIFELMKLVNITKEEFFTAYQTYLAKK